MVLPGREAAVRELITAELKAAGVLAGKRMETRVDALGNLLVRRAGNGGDTPRHACGAHG